MCVLLYKENGNILFLIQAMNDVEDFVDQYRRQAERWFVQQKESGLRHESTTDRQHLLLPTRQVCSHIVLQVA